MSSTHNRQPATGNTRKAIFFDRDGVINRRIYGGYVRTWDEFELLEEVAQTVKAVKERGYLAIVITNQQGVGKGVMSEDALLHLHSQLQGRMHELAKVKFDDIYYSTELKEGATRRKPSPAMLLEAAEKWNIDLAGSWMIGDSVSDVEAGKRAGTKTAFLITEHTTEVPEADLVLTHIRDLLPALDRAVTQA
ncbi:MAG TPA: HAD family hydrolase [Candidatus Kapabacteria bacterium]|nr:HAD family hydrolase [Candidatus Kapabacteria bacterium]